MNNNGEAFLKLLIPLIFLVIWALSQVLNKEGAGGRMAGAGRAGPSPWAGGGPAGRAGRGRDDSGGVVFTDSSGRPVPTARVVQENPRRRGGKNQRAAAQPQRKPDTSSHLPTLLQSSGTLTKPIPDMDPAPRGPVVIALDAEQIRASLVSPTRVREAILLAAVLSPPPGLKRFGLRQRGGPQD